MTLAPLPTDPDELRDLLEQLERRYEIGQNQGSDSQAGWLRHRIGEIRGLLGSAGSHCGPAEVAPSGGCSAVRVPVDPTSAPGGAR